MKLFLFGNGNISFNFFLEYYVPIINKAIENDLSFIVGDFRGSDVLIQEYLKDKTRKVEIYHCFDSPRYLADKFKTKVSSWMIKGGYATDLERDRAMINGCNFYFGVDLNSDHKRESGTLKNLKALSTTAKINYKDSV